MLKAIIRASHKSLSRLFHFCSENGKNHPVANQKLSKCFRSKCASEAGAGNDHLRFPVGVRSVAEIHKENLNRSSLMTYTFIDELCFSRMKLMRLLPVRLSQQPPQAYLHRAFPLLKPAPPPSSVTCFVDFRLIRSAASVFFPTARVAHSVKPQPGLMNLQS